MSNINSVHLCLSAEQATAIHTALSAMQRSPKLFLTQRETVGLVCDALYEHRQRPVPKVKEVTTTTVTTVTRMVDARHDH